jgi:UDP-glucose:(heptosyl)LPS alpha-1,3-glucosyltransferase
VIAFAARIPVDTWDGLLEKRVMMRLALVHMRHARTGGTERYLHALAAHLAELDHTVTIVCRRHEEAPHAAVRFVELRPVALGSVHRMLTFARAVEHHIRQADYDVVFGLGKTWSQDVLRLGGGCYQTYLDLTYRTPGQRLRRHFGMGWYKTRQTLAIEGRALAPGAYIRLITNSDMVKHDVMARYGSPADKITVIPNGVDLERFHPRHRTGMGAELRRRCGFEAGHVVLVFLGTGYYRKGLDRMLAVLPALLHERPATRLLVVGYDTEVSQWQARVHRCGLAAQVCFLGGRRDPEVCYGAGDLYVLPTRYDPFANATLEALATGLPVITTHTNGGCEVIVSGVQGAVIPNSDAPQPLLQALLQWTDRRQLQQGAQAARLQAEGYSVTRELQASTAVLMEVAALKQQGG